MATEKRLIDLDKIKPMNFPSTEMDGLDVVRYLNTLPTVDAVEVVRCRDCKFYELKNYPDGIQRMCCENRKAIWTATPPEAFCSYGERKDNG